MNFNKLILGKQELHDFENLLLKEKIIDSVQDDFDCLVDMKEEYNRARSQRIKIKSKENILTFLMLYEKIDATYTSIYNYSRFIDLGIIDPTSCLIIGTDKTHPTSKIVDKAWNSKSRIITVLYTITDAIFKANNIEIYSKNLIDKEYLLDLCDSYLYGTKSDFLSEYNTFMREIWARNVKRLYSGIDYNTEIFGSSLIDDFDLFERIEKDINRNADKIYKELSKYNGGFDDLIIYEQFNRKLDAYFQRYDIYDVCLNCHYDWKKCCSNSEFMYNISFNCSQRENIGSQKYAKLNGLILSSTENATLFDNSLKFKNNKDRSNNFIDDIYHIVNVDLSHMVNSLPVPENINEALRLRKRDEIVSLRNIYLEWSQCLYDGNVNEAQYIKKSFDEAIQFFEKRKIESKRKQSFLYCCFEALGNQIPHISNIAGIISPFINRKKLREEERHKWFLLTR